MRIGLRLLRWLTDGPLAAAIIGDLEEERRRRARTSPLAARLWLCGAWISLLGEIAWRKPGEALENLFAGGVGVRRRTGELRYAVRSLRRAPWYSTTIIGVMALAANPNAVVSAVIRTGRPTFAAIRRMATARESLPPPERLLMYAAMRCTSSYCTSTSALPVSGALQLNASGARWERPMASARKAYSTVVSPEPRSESVRKKFQRP